MARWQGTKARDAHRTAVAVAAALAANGARPLGAEARYDAAGTGRRIKGWMPPSSGPNQALTGLPRIRDRSRDVTRNDWAGVSIVQKHVNSLVGVGITPRWKSQDVDAAWAAFVPYADADGTSDAYGLQTLAVRSLIEVGEVFMRRRSRSLDAPLPAPVQFQLIESDFCPLFDAVTWPGMPEGNTIRQGVEFNRYGRRTAYWMYREHPGDGYRQATPSAELLLRIPASEISHVFQPKRPGQIRGVSVLASVLLKLRNAADFEDTTLERQKLANLFTMFITRQMPQSWQDIDTDATTGLPKWYDVEGRPVVGLEPGISQELAPGEDVKFATPPDAGVAYPDYMRATHLGTAAGAGLPYEFLAGDLKDISDRTLRVAVNEYRRGCEQLQWQVIIPRICQPMVDWWVRAVALMPDGPSAVDLLGRPEWTPHGWPDIHPVQDIEGRIKARDAGFVSTSAIIARSGEDPRKVQEQIAADKASGLTPPIEATAPSEVMLERRLDAIVSRMDAQGTSRGDAPLRTVEASLQTMQMMFTQSIRALTAAVEAIGKQTVNVAAPSVAIENKVEVPKDAVRVELPTRRIETDMVERDSAGNLTRVVQTERTLN